MLEGLFGSKAVVKALLFLFVNKTCYGTQLHRQLNTALTPIQKALLRLENGGIIASENAGKTRLYRFNPDYAALPELEHLLRKAYKHLPQDEKQLYNLTNAAAPKKANPSHIKMDLNRFWKRLASVQGIRFQAKSRSKIESGWKGTGSGEVRVTHSSDTVLLFHEKGTWFGENGQEMNFNNVFRWTLDKTAGGISLEHLRRGTNHPVFLFQLVPSRKNSLTSIDAHICGNDSYFGEFFCTPQSLHLHWRVIGLKKNEEIDTHYV